MDDPLGLTAWSPIAPNQHNRLKPYMVKFDVKKLVQHWAWNVDEPQIVVITCRKCAQLNVPMPLIGDGSHLSFTLIKH